MLIRKRGAKPQLTDVSCPNNCCKSYGISGKGNIIGNGIYQIKKRELGNISAALAAEYSMIAQITSMII